MARQSITRREFLAAGVSGATMLGTSPAAVAASSGSAATAKPNLLVVFSDQQHWNALGFRDDFFETPALDAFARESLVFENAFCTTPQCSPSRSSLLTGFYPSKTRVMGNVGNSGGNPLAQRTIATELAAAGYRTGYFGKWHLGRMAVAVEGWDRHEFKIDDANTTVKSLAFLREPQSQERPFAIFASLNNPHDIYHFKGHRVDPPGKRIPLPDSWAKETFEHKPPVQKQYMLEDQGKAIWGRPRRMWEQYRDCYRAKTRLYDRQFGKIVAELKRQGQWENTIVVVTSDHGDSDCCNRLIFKGPYMYEHMVRIPLMIRLPKQFGGSGHGTLSGLQTIIADVAPTIRDCCGLDARKADGFSLAPTLTGKTPQQSRDFVVSQYYGKQRWVNPIRMIRTADFKFNRYIRHGDELYDLKNDPGELVNLAADPGYAARKKDLLGELGGWIKANDDPFYSLKATTQSGEELG
ncbi:MAG: sulfatase-like hydrolase/transferase [Planctomycetota bacterium]|nr:sulfatase-like hydrolase/transferase [Planctomycetota bacterium]